MAFAAIFVAALLAYASVFFLDDPAKHGFKGEHSVAVVGGFGVAVFGTMALVSLYMWAAYYVERFTIKGTMLSIRSMLQDRQFDVSELQRLKWRAYPAGGGILFRVLGSKARLDLQVYESDDRLRMIRALHELVPSDIQEGWPLFCHKVALPLRDGISSMVRSEPSAVFSTITRKRYDRMLVVGLPASTALAVGAWAWLDIWHFAALPLVVIAAWLLLRFNVPSEGRSVVQLTSTSQGRAALVGWGAIVASQFLMIGLALLGVEKSTACGIACVVLLAAFPPMLYWIRKSDKHRRASEERVAEEAQAAWEQGEVAASC